MSDNEQADKPRIMIGDCDVTEYVASMYDAIHDSMDWGSGFLDVEQITAIMVIGKLAGWEMPLPTGISTNKGSPKGPPVWDSRLITGIGPEERAASYHALNKAHNEATRAWWEAQVAAELRSHVGEAIEDSDPGDEGGSP